jgi:DNA-directed RNA polymerase subunit alpha
MQSIAFPKKIEFETGDDERIARVVIEPCYPGYGTTLGNSLRRVLLSSLPGAAVVGVKISNANHEFSTLPHIKEDILDIVLNLKKLRLKVFSEETVKLDLDVHGEKVVTAADITGNSQVEIINKDLVIANITDMSGNLKMEIFVSQGRGYETIENREEKSREIGYIEMDSIFTPITAVSINIDNVRVGKITNWDKLVLDISTDGTLTPKEAFEQAVNVLIDQFSALSQKFEEKQDETENEPEAVVVGQDETVLDESEEVSPDLPTEEKKKRGRPKKL